MRPRLAVVSLFLACIVAVAPAGAQMGLSTGSYMPSQSTRPTYIASVGAQATTAAILLTIEAGASQGFRLVGWCISTSPATAAAAVTITVRRTTTASSGGTALTADGTGTTAISRLDAADAAYPGIARLNGTPGTAGATLDQIGTVAGLIGSVDSVHAPICKWYGLGGEKQPLVAAGVANGLSINVSSAGAGGLADGAITAIIALN